MSITVKCSAEYRTEDREPLTASRALTVFITGLPASAELHAITADIGSQRDPWHVLVGLRATWEDEK